jgi:hypothetical protein
MQICRVLFLKNKIIKPCRSTDTSTANLKKYRKAVGFGVIFVKLCKHTVVLNMCG